MWEPTAEIQAAAAAPSRAIGCGGGRRGEAQRSAGTRGHRQRETEPGRAGGAGLRQVGTEAGARLPGGKASGEARRRGCCRQRSYRGGRAGRDRRHASAHRGAGGAAAETTPPAAGGPGRACAEGRRRAGGRGGRRTAAGPAGQNGGRLRAELSRVGRRCRLGSGDAAHPARLVSAVGRLPRLGAAGEAGVFLWRLTEGGAGTTQGEAKGVPQRPVGGRLGHVATRIRVTAMASAEPRPVPCQHSSEQATSSLLWFSHFLSLSDAPSIARSQQRGQIPLLQCGAGTQHSIWKAAAVPRLSWMPTSAQVPLALEGETAAQASSIMGKKCLKQHVLKGWKDQFQAQETLENTSFHEFFTEDTTRTISLPRPAFPEAFPAGCFCY